MKTVEIKNLTKSRALQLIETGEIVLDKGKLYSKEDYALYEENIRLSQYYDMLQGVRKVLLNSSYGATLNEWSRFMDPRLGASTTGSGRQITTFMLETITEQLVGEKIPLIKTSEESDEGEVENVYTIDCPTGLGPVMADTDSVDAKSIVEFNGVNGTIEHHFEKEYKNSSVYLQGHKEILWTTGIVSPCFDTVTNTVIEKLVKGIYRHKVSSKARYKITLSSGKSVIVTGDHSIMVERAGNLIEVKPHEINTDTDISITHYVIPNKI